MAPERAHRALLLRELIKQHHREIRGPDPKNPKLILRQIWAEMWVKMGSNGRASPS